MIRATLTRVTLLVTLLATLMVSTLVSAKDYPDFTQLVEKYQPAVVNISTTRMVKPKAQHHGFPMPYGHPGADQFQEMLRRFFGEQMQPQEEFNTKSLGSGFIISKDGYILTNNHVIRDADEVVVRLSDGRELEAKLIGADEGTDLALLKVDEKNLPTVKFGSSDDLKVGEWVLAIGSPFGFEHTVTAGIVSAKKRGLHTEQYVPFIQTDVAINPGNSGGPLFNLDGEVVGINSQIVSRTGGYLGLSFAIPSDTAKNIVKQLKAKGHVTRGWLGVSFQNVDRELAQSFGLDSPKGALVAQIVPDSPAEKAGLRRGDIILRFNGTHVKDAIDLSPLVGTVNPGDKVPVEVMRNKKLKTITVTIAKLEKEQDQERAKDLAKQDENSLGLLARNFTAAERARFDLGDEGVVVEAVKRGGPAYRAGIRRGDMLLSLNMQAVNNEKQFAKALKSIGKKKTVPVLISRRGEGQRYFALKIAG